MKNSLIITGLVLSLTLATPETFASKHHRDDQRRHDYAKVLKVIPIYKTIQISEPHQECYDEQVTYNHRLGDSYTSATPMIAGGVLGGILGNQFGGGNGKKIMTVAGTILGGSMGRDAGHHNKRRHNDYRTTTERRCNVVNSYREEERIDGYRVTYRYHGKKYTTRMPYDPGRRIKVRVSVKPYR